MKEKVLKSNVLKVITVFTAIVLLVLLFPVGNMSAENMDVPASSAVQEQETSSVAQEKADVIIQQVLCYMCLTV